jgi:hypothetical protein
MGLWAVLLGLILAGMFGCLSRPNMGEWGKYYLDVVAVGLGLAVAIYVLSWAHVLLPSKHRTICNVTGKTGEHHLAYVTDVETDALEMAGGRGTAAEGLLGTQGIKCYPFDQAAFDATMAEAAALRADGARMRAAAAIRRDEAAVRRNQASRPDYWGFNQPDVMK